MADALKFFDVKTKKSFTTDDYKIVVKKGRRFAVAEGPEGNNVYRILGKG